MRDNDADHYTISAGFKNISKINKFFGNTEIYVNHIEFHTSVIKAIKMKFKLSQTVKIGL